MTDYRFVLWLNLEAKVANLNFKDVKLSDGRVVTVRELTGADEMLSIRLMGKEMSLDQKEVGAAVMTQQNVLVCLSVFKIDGEPCKTPNSLEAVMQTLTQYKLSDWNKIRGAFNDLNAGDDFLDEPTA